MGTTNHCIKELVFDPPPPTDSVSCHAWNADRSMLALSPNNETIHIYIDGGNGIWKLKKILEEHTFKVSGLDWSEVTNKLVSCGEDRNAFVWSVHIEKEEIVFKSEPVLLNLSNSATCVRWSPSGQKFALGSCSDSIFICYYDGESKLWASKVLKEPFSSSVLSVAWHPNEILLGCGCMDSHVIVVSAYIKDMDSKEIGACPWGSRFPFGKVCGKYKTGGWVLATSFSPDGNRLFWTDYSGSVSYVDPQSGTLNKFELELQFLPFRAILFIEKDVLVVGGFDFSPVGFRQKGEKWYMNDVVIDRNCMGRLDVNVSAKGESETAVKSSAFNMFRQMVSKGISENKTSESENLVLKNTISVLKCFDGRSFSSSSYDGKVCVWSMENVSGNASDVSIITEKLENAVIE